MYRWIGARLPERYAVPAAAFVYAVMLLLTLYFSFERQAEFNYLTL